MKRAAALPACALFSTSCQPNGSGHTMDEIAIVQQSTLLPTLYGAGGNHISSRAMHLLVRSRVEANRMHDKLHHPMLTP